MDVGKRGRLTFRLVLRRSNANVNSRCVRAKLIGQFEGVASSVLFLHPGDDESGQVVRGLDVETASRCHFDAPPTARPLNVFGVTGEGTGHC